MPARRLLAIATLAALATGCLNEVESTPVGQRTPTLLPSTRAVTYSVALGAPSPAATTVTVVNGGDGTLAPPAAAVTFSSGAAGWLTAQVAGAAAPYVVTLTPATAAVPVGTHVATVTLTSAGAARPVTIQVTLTVILPASLVLSSAELAFTAPVGSGDPAAQTVTVTNGGGQPLAVPTVAITYGNAEPTGWLTVGVAGTAAPYTLTVQAAAGALPGGSYTALVELQAAGASNSPVGILVTFEVPRLVTLTRLLTHWAEQGITTQVADPDVQSIELLQDDGAGGTLRATATAGATAGTWSARLPAGPYWILATRAAGGVLYVQASADAVDLGVDVAGRADVVRADAPTEATLDLLALEPWDTLNDALSLVSYGAQAGALFDSFSAPALPLFDGDVDLFGFAFDWSTMVGPLLAASDQLWITQLRFRLNATADLEYLETRTFSSITGLSMESGTPVALTAPDAQFVTGSGQLRLDWRRSQFEAALPPSTSTDLQAHVVSVSAIPAPLEAPSPLGAVAVPLLVTVRSPTSAFDPDFPAGSLPYGTFLPAGWNEVFTASLGLDVTRTAPGAITEAPGLRDQVFRSDAAASAPDPVVPLVGGPLLATIDGADALVAQPGRSTTPTLAWSAPAAGTASSYVVEVHRLAANGTASEVTPVAQFVLTGTSLTLPTGLLAPGQSYLVRLVARSNPADAGGASPFRKGVPYGEAAYWTEQFATAP